MFSLSSAGQPPHGPETASFSPLRRLLACFASASLVLLSGCANLQPAEPTVPDKHVDAITQASDSRWHFVRFRFNRNAQGAVDSYLDVMIADQVVAALIDDFSGQLSVWRFHRRWPEDDTGHQFSFMFMAPTDVAGRLIARIRAHGLLQQLRGQGYLADFRVDRPSGPDAMDIAASSDRSWPEDIQREWPHFIMGASRMWLGLATAAASRHPDSELHQRYVLAEQALDKLWLDKGNHALLHHLSALFGYKPVRVIRRDIMRF